MGEPNTTTRSYWLLVLLILAVTTKLVASWSALPDGTMRLFGRWDVLLVAMLAATPVTVMIAHGITRSQRWQNALIVLALIVSVVFLIGYASLLTTINVSTLLIATTFRTLVAMTIMLAILISVSLIRTHPTQVWPVLPAFTRTSWAAIGMLVALAVFIPLAYADSVAEGIRIQIEPLLPARRFALATRHAEQLRQLQPQSVLENKPIAIVIQELQQIVNDIELSLQRSSKPIETGQRIMALMQLDRNSEALELLEPLTQGPNFQPISLDYQGLCWQRMECFRESLDAYQQAVQYWQTQPPTPRQRESLASAWKGVGFAARRLHERRVQVNAYQQLVEVAPSAANHLLLAQCYREHQQTRLASEHASIAEALDPSVQPQSQSMRSSMSTDHFGCWLVPRR